MPDYEKGVPAWDIAQIITRHVWECDRRANLRRTAGMGLNSTARLAQSLATKCTCHAGDSDSERTSILAPRADLLQRS